MAAFLGGVLGGLVCGLVVSGLVALFGPRVAERLLKQQVAYLEARLKENVLEVALGKVGAFLDQSERIGQVVKRVAEIAQLLLRRDPVQAPPTPEPGNTAQALRELLVAAMASATKPVPPAPPPSPAPPASTPVVMTVTATGPAVS
jgi:hypothetical protein